MASAAAYASLNAAYWMVAALPNKKHWDLSCFTKDVQRISHSNSGGLAELDSARTFTTALWEVIVVTKSIAWARWSKDVPHSKAWDEWLEDALEVAQMENVEQDKMPACNASGHLKSILTRETALRDGSDQAADVIAGSERV